MPLFRTVSGRYFDIPSELIKTCQVQLERMDGKDIEAKEGRTLFRMVDGRFIDIPEAQLKKLQVMPERMEKEYREEPVIAIQIPRDMASKGFPSDIKLAHYGTTIDNPHR